MGHIVTTIFPIFSLVILGTFARSKGFLPPEFLGPANRLVCCLAVPVLIFRAIANASLTRPFNLAVIWLSLVALVVLFGIGWASSRLLRLPASIRGSLYSVFLSRESGVYRAGGGRASLSPAERYRGWAPQRGGRQDRGQSGDRFSDNGPLFSPWPASPTATIACVMAREMGADSDFAVAAISATTLFSAVTFSFWLGLG